MEKSANYCQLLQGWTDEICEHVDAENKSITEFQTGKIFITTINEDIFGR